ncbi:MAG TPA: zf-HC2 domain-containing protein [Pyrinomonadaceae bacterium]|jgi:hypothetical protein|nr:zf-HC2 domain-containing protein [Pyrinomonadaceae bacterium]
MRPESNNEIDLLLRQLSRRNGAPVSENEEQHLDADELNSYVANALPPAARARYTEHLADCTSCRKLVAQLSAAQGPASVSQSGSVVAPSGLKSFLASLFSPMVLRYAVPALGLVVIAVVGIVVFRQNERQGSIAGLTEAQQRKEAVNQPQPAESASPQAYYDNNTVAKNNTSRAEKEATPSAAGDVAPVTKEAPAVAKGAVDETGTAAAEPPPAAPKAAQKVDAEDEEDSLKLKKDAAEKQAAAREANKERDIASKNEPAKAETSTVTVTQDTTARKDIAVRSAKSADADVTRGSALKRAPAPAGGTASATGQADSRSREQSNEQSKPTGTFANAETRSVAGRRFRKIGSVWTDTGYDSSSAVTVVKRGSEQYRALIADEPSIREIADALDGEVIVVWKGRTYRIR